MQKHLRFLVLYLLLPALNVQAQEYFSPSSQYGLGELYKPAFVQQQGIAGAGTAFLDENQPRFSLSNPASFSQARRFSLEFGLGSKFYEQKSDEARYRNKDFNFSYLTFHLPIWQKKQWGFAAGLYPVSKTGYYLEQNKNTVVSSTERWKGTGGYTVFFVGSGIQLVKGLYIGAQAGYLFGREETTHTLTINDTIASTGYEKLANMSLGDFVYGGGAIYSLAVNSQNKLRLGVSAQLPGNVKGNRTLFGYEFRGAYATDTTISTVDQRIEATLPGSYNAGIQWQEQERWLFALDLNYQDWSNFRFPGKTESLKDASSVAFGLQLTPAGNVADPNLKAMQPYTRRISYRAGVRYGQSYLPVQGSPAPQYSFTLGAGFPLSRGGKLGSAIDVSVEAGQIGALPKQELQERFIRLNLGLHLFDEHWFERRGID